MPLPILLPIFLAISILYSTVGLGGGSAYITAMVLAGVPKETFPIIALGCNLIVAGQGFLRFKSAGHFKWDLFWPFAITSIPFAYLGGRLHIPDKIFTTTLVMALAVAAIRLLVWKSSPHPHPPPSRHYCVSSEGARLPTPERSDGGQGSASGGGGQVRGREGEGGRYQIASALLVGSLLGLLAGITGIGGGIYLIPVLLFLHWALPKEASAVASLFVVVNSFSGFIGQLSKGSVDWKFFLPLALTVLVGGFIGARMGATRLRGETLQKIVGIIMLIAVGKLVAMKM